METFHFGFHTAFQMLPTLFKAIFLSSHRCFHSFPPFLWPVARLLSSSPTHTQSPNASNHVPQILKAHSYALVNLYSQSSTSLLTASITHFYIDNIQKLSVQLIISLLSTKYSSICLTFPFEWLIGT